MTKKITLIRSLTFFMSLFCVVNLGFGQILTFNFAGKNGDEESVVSNYNNENLLESKITRGAGLTAGIKGGRFNAINWGGTSIADAITQNDYMQFTISPNTGFQFDVSTIVVNFQRKTLYQLHSNNREETYNLPNEVV